MHGTLKTLAASAKHALRLAHYHYTLRRGRPYFGPIHAARQGDRMRHPYMLATVALLPTPPRILEIGTWAGSSALTWAEGVTKFHGGKGSVSCVDAWTPYDDPRLYHRDQTIAVMNRSAASGAILELFLHNIACSPFGRVITYKRGTSREVLPTFPASSFDMVYIDGSHRYGDAAYDMQEAKRLVTDNGIICGDDLELEIGDVSVDEARNESQLECARNARTNRWYHPGVTIAVHEHFGTVSRWNGYFAVRLQGDKFVSVILPADCRVLPSHLA